MSELNVMRIEKMIFVVRGVKVMFDSDLTELYGVESFRDSNGFGIIVSYWKSLESIAIN